MKEVQQLEVFPAIPPTAIKDDAAFVSRAIDVADADYMEFHVNIGATDVAMAALKVMESDTLTNATTLGGTPAEVVDVTTKPGATADDSIWIVGVKCHGRKRYLQLQATAGDGTAGTFMAATAVVRRSGTRSSTAAARGVAYAQYA